MDFLRRKQLVGTFTPNKMNQILCFGLCIIFMGLVTSAKDTCPRLEAPKTFNRNQIAGTWYVVRGIEHNHPGNGTAKHSKKCSEVVIVAKGERQLEFNWKSKSKPSKKFTMKSNPNKPGVLEDGGKGGSFRKMQITTVEGENGIWSATICRHKGNISTVVLHNAPSFNKIKVAKITDKLHQQGLDVSNSYDRCFS